MVFDSLENLSGYAALHPLFAKAFEYIQQTNIAEVEVGKYDIAEGLKAIYSDKPGISAEESNAKFECHDKHIDIQICIKGNERIGWRSRNRCTKPKGEYNVEKDVNFYADEPTTYFELTDKQFVIFYPNDVHSPMIKVNDDSIKKLVIKVKI